MRRMNPNAANNLKRVGHVPTIEPFHSRSILQKKGVFPCEHNLAPIIPILKGWPSESTRPSYHNERVQYFSILNQKLYAYSRIGGES
jgi:hypothetical protein